MKIFKPGHLTLSAVLLFACYLFAQEEGVGVFKKCPSASGWDYRCEDMVRVVNQLIRQGKDQSLAMLQTYIDGPGADYRKIHLVCRLLFVNTNGWEYPRIGAPVTSLYRTNALDNGAMLPDQHDLVERLEKQFPQFPLVLQDNVPFIVIEGFSGSGRIERPNDLIQQCKNLPLISDDLSRTNFEAAARTLIKSREFISLYPNPYRAEIMAEMILRQAGVTNKASGNK